MGCKDSKAWLQQRVVILSAAVFQAERRISREPSARETLTRLNCAGFRDDAFPMPNAVVK